jgi:hypothetical protein
MDINEVKNAMAKIYDKENNLAVAKVLKDGFNQVLKELSGSGSSGFGKVKDLFGAD